MNTSGILSSTSSSTRCSSTAGDAAGRVDFRRARLSRDARFDGLFFIGVKTTGIFCRPICPAVPPLESNVEYFDHASQAFRAGYRPCLRCRPDSAPGSCAWRGTDTTFTRALKLIDAGALRSSSLPALAERLGISDRYLRRLFQQRLGLSPKAYALFGQILFAKKLLHETSLSVTDIAAAAGFNSLRRFNDAFLRQLQLAPGDIRRKANPSPRLCLSLAYRPPLNWQAMLDFWRKRCVTGIEEVDDKAQSYGRSFEIYGQDRKNQNASQPTHHALGWFNVSPGADENTLELRVEMDQPALLKPLVNRIRQLLDLDADTALIEQQLAECPGFEAVINPGLRIPGIWHPFEAGVRAILGQQVSVAAARTHLGRLVQGLGEPLVPGARDRLLFPSPAAIATSDLAMLKMPASRRDTLRNFARWFDEQGDQQPIEKALALKGIGPWTVDYIKMRGLGDTDIWLAGDLGIKKAVLAIDAGLNSEQLRPWRSYATFHLWSYLGDASASTTRTAPSTRTATS